MVHAMAVLLAVAAAPAAGDAAAARAREAGAGRPVVPLASANDVARLCAALLPGERTRPAGDALQQGEAAAQHERDRAAALAARYEIEVPAAGLAFAPYDGPERRLSLAEPVQIAIAGSTARVWPVDARDLGVQADASQARRVLDAQRGGTLSIALTFDLPDDATCGTGARGKKFVIPVEPVAWRWLASGAVLARGGAGSDRPALTLRDGARPRVDVGEPIAGPGETKKAVLAHAGELEACYAEALKRDPGIDGVLVAELGGERPAISADSVGDKALAACVERALGPLAPVQGGKAAVPIRFELEPPGLAKPANVR